MKRVIILLISLVLFTACNMGQDQFKNDPDYQAPNGECKYCVEWDNVNNKCKEIDYGVCM